MRQRQFQTQTKAIFVFSILIFFFSQTAIFAEDTTAIQASASQTIELQDADFMQMLKKLVLTTGAYSFFNDSFESWHLGIGKIMMIIVGFVLLFLGIKKKFEPLLLIPIAFGCIMANIPNTGLNDEGGLLYYIFSVGINTGILPLIVFLCIGSLTDFGPMISNPMTALLGAGAQFGIFITLLGALLLNNIDGINFSLQDAASIGIIGGADGPTAIFVSSVLAPDLLGSIAIAAYSYMALVPIIQPPIIRLFTTKAERCIKMTQSRHVSKIEKIIFPIIVVILCGLIIPSSVPLVGMLMFGNLLKESGVVDRLSGVAQNALINIVTIFLGLGVGSKLLADKFLKLETIGILLLGLVAFSIGTASGILVAKLMNLFRKNKINPIIGAAGVSAVPMAARVANKVGQEADPQNFLLMHAMGPNVSGVIGSAVAAGVLLTFLSQ